MDFSKVHHHSFIHQHPCLILPVLAQVVVPTGTSFRLTALHHLFMVPVLYIALEHHHRMCNRCLVTTQSGLLQDTLECTNWHLSIIRIPLCIVSLMCQMFQCLTSTRIIQASW